VLAVVVLIVGVVAWRSGVFGGTGTNASAGPSGLFPDDRGPSLSPSPTPSPTFAAGPINPKFPGLTTWRGNLTRSYYGEGPVPQNPVIRWRWPSSGGVCGLSDFGTGSETRCGFAWTGQPNVIPKDGGGYEIRIGAYDHNYHFLDGFTGEPVRGDVVTGDVAKGSATSDPDGYPLYYGGSRDNLLRVVALDRGQTPEVLWSLDANTSVSNPVWNDDWDGAPLIVGDYMLEGGENSWFYVIRLHRGYDDAGKVTVDPKVVAAVPGYDQELLSSLDNDDVSIESSVAFFDGVAYFVNSGGLVQGWDISKILAGGTDAPERVFRFWNGDDSDGTIAIDEEGFLYVPKHNEHDTARNSEVGDLIKLDPSKPNDPLVWSVDVNFGSTQHEGGIWSTPALYGKYVYVTTTYGEVIAINRATGLVRWKMKLNDSHTWGSPNIVDDTLIVGDCSGVLHAWDISTPGKKPPELWNLSLDGTCIEATPAVYDGWIWAGTRGGALYGISDPA
jgi:hypothetical protein